MGMHKYHDQVSSRKHLVGIQKFIVLYGNYSVFVLLVSDKCVQRFSAVNLTIYIQIEEVIHESVLTVNIGIQVTCIYARKTTILFSYVL